MVTILANIHKYFVNFKEGNESVFYQEDTFLSKFYVYFLHSQQFSQNQHFTYLWIFGGYNFDKI